MAFADNNLSDDLRTRIIAGEVGSSMFHTYQNKNENEYMTDTETPVPQIHIVYETNKCVKTNRILSIINLMLLVLLIVLTYMVCLKE